jgi:DNA repair protein RecO (recombination protein O)
VWGSFLLYQSPRRLYVKNVDIAEDFLSVRSSGAALVCAVNWHARLASRLAPNCSDNNLLSLLWGCMKNLSRKISPALLDARFAWRWGNIWGVAPSLESCPDCGGPLDYSGAALAPRSPEGFLCPTCAARREGTWEAARLSPLSRDAFELAREITLAPAEQFVRDAPRNAAAMSTRPTLRDEIQAAAAWFYSFV